MTALLFVLYCNTRAVLDIVDIGLNITSFAFLLNAFIAD